MQNIPPAWYKITDDGILLAVRVLPGARHESVQGLWNNTHLKIALRSPAVEGRANEALIEFLSHILSVRKSAIVLLSGQKNRLKWVKISPFTNVDQLNNLI